MQELFLWIVTSLNPLVGIGLVVFTGFFVDCKKRKHAKTYNVDKSCQTDKEEEPGQELERMYVNCKQNLAGTEMSRKPVKKKPSKISPYIWDYAYWPSEGGV